MEIQGNWSKRNPWITHTLQSSFQFPSGRTKTKASLSRDSYYNRTAYLSRILRFDYWILSPYKSHMYLQLPNILLITPPHPESLALNVIIAWGTERWREETRENWIPKFHEKFIERRQTRQAGSRINSFPLPSSYLNLVLRSTFSSVWFLNSLIQESNSLTFAREYLA